MEAIVKGEPMPQPGIPESLNVLLHELRGLGLSINLNKLIKECRDEEADEGL